MTAAVIAYLLAVAASAVVLAVALRRRPAPVPPAPPAPAVELRPGTEIRVILAAAHQLAARLDTAA